MYPGENNFDEIERYFMEEAEDDLDEEEMNVENIFLRWFKGAIVMQKMTSAQ